MKLTTIFATLAFLAATGSALPTAEASESVSNVDNPLIARADGCGFSTFVKETSTGSASIQSCINLVEKFRRNNKFYGVGKKRKEILREGNCRFVAVADSDGVKIGNVDAAEIIRDAISNFGENGRVGARGTMHCIGGPAGTSKVDWWIWKT